MKLNEAQNLFKKYILNPTYAPELEKMLRPASHLSLNDALQMYRQKYLTRLTAILSETFASSWQILGDEKFLEASRNYIATQPSTSYDLSEYGAHFPEFLALSKDGQKFPFLFDLARLEWTYQQLHNSPTPRSLPTENVRELLYTGNFKIHFIEGMEIFQSPYAVYNIWKYKFEPHLPLQDIEWKKPESLLLYKKMHKVLIQPIDHVDAQILLQLKDGADIGEALSQTSQPMSKEKTSQLFHLLMKAGLIEDVLCIDD